ncbi:hypothetical protein [Sphingomonas sp.]|uniref:hypothetical protein n=1 Tax=Sphingomonas sp. TaxID=28214 RepID=UPI0035C86D1D
MMRVRIGGQGRPLRFLMIVIGGWTGARVALVWNDPAGERLIAAPRLAPLRRADARPAIAPAPLIAAASLAASEMPLVRAPRGPSVPSARRGSSRLVSEISATNYATTDETRFASAAGSLAAFRPLDQPPEQSGAAIGIQAAQPVATALPTRARWSGSAWAFVRGTGAAGGVATPQLGGSQIGARVAYRLDSAGRVAAVARAAAATGVRQQEAAVGVEWQPTRAPIRIVAEQRIGIANIRGGPALGLVGGVSALPLGAGLRVDGYAQGGVIARDRADGYVDGALSIGRTVATRGARLELGLGAWGAAQRGASRLDLGPAATLVLPVDGRGIRAGVQWRERIAGNARPGSGAVLSLGADF